MADKSKNTGTGGINVDGKVHTMDVGVPEAQVDNTKDYSSGDIAVDKTIKDISNPTRETFAKYLSKTTLGTAGSSTRKNVYPVGNGDQTAVLKTTIKDAQGNPVSPGPQNNEAKFNADFNQQISSNNPAGIRRGAATGTGPDGNELLANIAPPNAVGKAILTPAAANYTASTVDPNLYDYNSDKVGIADGTLNATPTNLREDLRYIPADSSINIDGGKSTNILGPDATAAPDYTLTLIDRATQASIVTAGNFFKIDAPTSVANALSTTKIVLSTPLSATDAQNNPFASSFFTKEIQTISGVDKVVSKLESSYTDAFVASSEATDKFIIKRGKTEKTGGVDGNALLSTIAPKVDDKVALTPGAKTYIAAVLKPNLNDIYNPKTESGVVIPEYENIGEPSGIKDLNKTSTFALDAGTSKAILSGERKLSLENAAAVPSIKTSDNFYPVDSLQIIKVDDKSVATLKIINSSVDKLAKTSNTKYFADIAIGSNPTVNSKGKLKNQDNDKKDLPDGNTLLPLASTAAPSDANYVKFVAASSDGKTGLQQPIKKYTGTVVEPNLYDYDTSPVGLSAGSIGESPTNLREDLKYIPPDASISVDGGSSTNILGPGGGGKDYTLTLIDRATQASTVTAGNFFKIDLPDTETVNGINVLVTKKLTGITPDSATDSQNHPFNSSFFTKGTQQILGGAVVVYSKLKSSYSLALTDAESATANKFIIKRGKTEKTDGVDGNALLSTIAPESVLGVATLTPGAKTYTTIVLDANLYSPLDKLNQLDDKSVVETGDFFGPRNLYKPLKGPEDAGTFDNIQKDPSKRAITQASLFKHVVDEVAGKNAPGNIGNVYKISDAKPENLFSFTTPEGVPASPTTAQNNIVSLAQYVLPAGTGAAKLVKLQPSYSNASENLEIRRGKSKQDELPDGNTLLKDAAEAADAGPYVKKSGEVSPTISKYVGAVLDENRYSPRRREQFVPSDTPGAEGKTQDGADPSPGGQRFENISDKGAPETSFVGRTTLYAPSELKFGESPQSMVNRGERPTGYTFRRLTRIGTILQLRAAGEIISITGDQNDDPRSNVEQLAALLPGAGQAGAGVPLSRELLNVTEIIKNLPDESIGAAGISTITQYEGELIDINTTFEGIVNTALEKFSGFSSLGLLVLAIAFVAVIIVAIWGILGNLLSSSSALDRTEKHPGGIAGSTSSGIHGLGSFQGRGMTGGTNFIADLVKAVTQVPSSGAVSLFGISPTFNREYSDAVYRGALAFFGLGASPPPLLAYPGQVIVTARAIVRGVSRLVLAFSDIISAFTTGNVFSAIFKLIDIIEVIRNSKVIKALNTFSQIGDRRPFTILSDLYKKDLPAGEVAALPPPGGTPTEGSIAQSKTTGLFGGVELFQQTATDEYDIGVKISEIDSVIDTADEHKMLAPVAAPGAPAGKFINKEYIGISQVKSRLQGSTALAWSTYRAPSLFVTTKDLNFKPDDGSQPKFDINNAHAATYSNEGPRIDSAAVRAFEDALDGEYMPFYFQDLRTNEIIGLHAFLLSLSDDYSANYESISGLGRAEPVRIYKDTQRKIGLSFMLAALDKNDFNHMWDKVNRLTMLAYPQYTRGKIYNNSSLGIQFEKPFTQQVGASPMVRLRLGNLLRSNYSKFNLAKIFGIGGGGTKVNLTEGDKNKQVAAADRAAKARGDALVAQAQAAAIKELKDNDKTIKYTKDFQFILNKAAVYKTRLDDKTAKLVGLTQPQASPPSKGPAPKLPQQAPNARYVADGDWYRTFAGDAGGPLRFKISGIFPPADPKYAKGTFVALTTATDADKISLPPGENEYFVPIVDLTMDTDTTTKYDAAIAIEADNSTQVKAAKANQPKPTYTNETIAASENEFMLAANNVIVRSFESTGGKGLAGFIDSINFDWYDRTTWDIDIDRKAPQMCKVTISFTPIHDISPGLDAYGNNRAPIYPLGPYAYGTRK